MSPPYHHGDLPRAVLERAAAVIASDGPYAFSLRSLAADLGVSHTAPRHHFGSREGVLNALATQGFGLLGDSLRRVRQEGGTFLDVGVAYVEFALAHRAHFEIMFAPALLDGDDPELNVARETAFAELTGGADAMLADGRGDDPAATVLAGWSLVHGLATLALSGNLAGATVAGLLDGEDLVVLARRSASLLFGPAQRPADPPEPDPTEPDPTDPEPTDPVPTDPERTSHG